MPGSLCFPSPPPCERADGIPSERTDVCSKQPHRLVIRNHGGLRKSIVKMWGSLQKIKRAVNDAWIHLSHVSNSHVQCDRDRTNDHSRQGGVKRRRRTRCGDPSLLHLQGHQSVNMGTCASACCHFTVSIFRTCHLIRLSRPPVTPKKQIHFLDERTHLFRH